MKKEEDKDPNKESHESDSQDMIHATKLKILSDSLDASCLETYYEENGIPTLDMLSAGLPEGTIHSDLEGEAFVNAALKELKANYSIPALFILIGIKTSDENILQQIKMITSEVSNPEKLFPRTWTRIRVDDQERIKALWSDPTGKKGEHEANSSGHLTLKRVLSKGYYEQLVECFSKEADANILLDSIGFPTVHKPLFNNDPRSFWHTVCREISHGVGITFETLFRAAGKRYPANPLFSKF